MRMWDLLDDTKVNFAHCSDFPNQIWPTICFQEAYKEGVKAVTATPPSNTYY